MLVYPVTKTVIEERGSLTKLSLRSCMMRVESL